MPALIRPEEPQSIDLPSRKAQLAAETDVLVVGGGPSGLGAALGATAAGCQVILAERYGFLGGNATASLVMPLMSYHTQSPLVEKKTGDEPLTPVDTSLLPIDHGHGEPVVSGVLTTLLGRLVSAEGAISPSLRTGYVVPFDPEIFKLVALDLLDEAGVQFLFHALATQVIGSGQIEGVVFETKSGPIVIRAKSVIDCSGDGDIAALGGAPFEIGREEDGLVQPMTLMFRMVEFERAAFDAYLKKHPDQWYGVHGLWDLVRQATEKGELELPREDVLFFGTPHAREVSVNCTRITKVFGTNVWDLSYAEWKSRHQMRQVAAFLRHYVPGFEKAYLVQSGTTIGVRESRRITGEYQLNADDIANAR
ncbi:MAG TPA: FAD-dependent oxidoreductase, partial [bacterium]|nr:FAD-dependent oxidoreductase [bacterium]